MQVHPSVRRQGAVQAQTLSLSGTKYERVLRTQQVDACGLDNGAQGHRRCSCVDLPFGVQPSTWFRVQAFPLEPGDRLAFVTDGMLERNAAQLDVAATLRQTSDLHPREVVHALGAAALRATAGDLRDDATVVVLDWYGGPVRRRESTRGASRQHASP